MTLPTRAKIAVIALAGILILVNWSIWAKEQQLANGRVVYLKLAPVDPRSIMQGDFMRLRFEIANSIYRALPKSEEQRWGHDLATSDGLVKVVLDDRQIATFSALFNEQQAPASGLEADEALLRYRVRNGAVKFATNAFFFQEGLEPVYRNAQYGKFRVDDKGELLLTALYDEALTRLGEK